MKYHFSSMALFWGWLALIAMWGCGSNHLEEIDEARASVESGDLAVGIKALEQVIAADPYNHRAMGLLGQWYIKEERWDRAIALLEKAHEIAPDYSQYALDLGYAHWAMSQTQSARPNQVKMAIRALREAIEIDPHYSKPHLLLGEILLSEGHKADAIDAYFNAILGTPPQIGAYEHLAAIYLKLGFAQRAYAVLQLAQSRGLNSDELQELLGKAARLSGHPDLAVEIYRNLIQKYRLNGAMDGLKMRQLQWAFVLSLEALGDMKLKERKKRTAAKFYARTLEGMDQLEALVQKSKWHPKSLDYQMAVRRAWLKEAFQTYRP